jgi:hypothetical protein
MLPAVAQQQAPIITVAAVTRAQPASKMPLAIEVGPRQVIARNSFIRIRGVPPTAALTEGHAIAPGAWAVPLVALPALSIILPVGIESRSDLSISLVSLEGAVLAEARTTLIVEASLPAGPEASSKGAAPERPPLPRLTSEERGRAQALVARGSEQLERGNIYAARKFFERAAEAGLAQGALSAAATYDPNELGRLNVVGLQPDVEAARKWYEKARELGAPDINERLRRLGQR